MGYAVDRFGPRRMLIAGLCLSGIAYGSIGVFPVYAWLIGAAVLAGIANPSITLRTTRSSAR